MQRAVCGWVRVPRRLYQRDGGAVSSRPVLGGQCRDVHTLRRWPVRVKRGADECKLQRFVPWRRVWLVDGPDCTELQWAVSCWVRLPRWLCQRHSGAVPPWPVLVVWVGDVHAV